MHLSKIPLIILAAGKSSRMGFPKGLMIYQQQKLLQHQINAYFKYGGKKIIVVLGEHREIYLEKISALSNCEIIFNDHIDWGPFYSLQLALKQIEHTPCCFVLPMDTPAANPSTWKKLAKFQHQKHWVIQARFNNQGGHPIMLAQSFYKTLLDVDPKAEDGRLDRQIKKLSSDKTLNIPVSDPHIILNINSL